MKKNKPYLTGVWGTGLITVYQVLTVAFAYYLASRFANMNAGLDEKASYPVFRPSMLIWPLLFLLEHIVYWKLRYQNQKKNWVLVHVISQLIVFVGIPFSFLSLTRAFTRPGDMEFLLQVRWYGSWFLFIVGHIFFLAIIARSFRAKKTTTPDEPPAGILDEFIK